MSGVNATSKPDLIFSYLADNALYKKAFCVNPVSAICPFGPCPNTDVTGLGQQISIYITTIIYGFILCYIPWLKRPMLYAHLAVLYSLLIAGTVSVAKHELTKADAMFVIICVASPATLYLWYLTIRSFWNANVFPIQHSNKKKTASQSWEVKLTRLVVLGTLAYTISFMVITFAPSKIVKFSQPDCDVQYGTELWFNLAWMLPFAMQTVAIAILFYLSWGLIKLWTMRLSYEAPSPVFSATKGDTDYEALDKTSSTNTGQVDLITWTEVVLNDQFPNFMNHAIFIAIVTLMQISALPTITVWPIDSKDLLAWLIITVGLFRHRPKYDSNWVKEYIIRVAISVFFAGYYILRMIIPLVPTAPDWVFFFVSCTAAAWCRRNYTGSMRIFLPIFLVIFGMGVLVVNIFVVVVGDPKAFAGTSQLGKQPDGSDYSYLVLNISVLCLWIVSWLATSAWPFKRSLTWDKLNKGLFRRAHIFKSSWIILGPHIMWIQSSNNASPSRSNDMPFGQIFALIVAIVTLFTLLDEAKDVSAPVWLAFFKSDPMPFDDEERPKHYAVRPGLAMS